MRNRGFAVSGIFYTILIIFLILITVLLLDLQSKKTLLDKLKGEAVEATECDNNYEFLLKKIQELEGIIQGLKNNQGYTKTQVDNKLNNYYTKIETDNKLTTINNSISSINSSINSIISTQNTLNSKFNNYYTKSQIDSKLSGLGSTDLSNYYTKSESNARFLTSHQSLSDYYTKSQVDSLTSFGLTSGSGKWLKTMHIYGTNSTSEVEYTWTATDDCWVYGKLQSANKAEVGIRIDMGGSGYDNISYKSPTTAVSSIPVVFPIKKGTKIVFYAYNEKNAAGSNLYFIKFS